MVWGVTSRSDFLPVRGMVADVSFEGPGAQEPQELHPPLSRSQSGPGLIICYISTTPMELRLVRLVTFKRL